MGSEYINDFDYNDRTYRVYVQADQQFRMNRGSCPAITCRSDLGQMIPLDNLVTVASDAVPVIIALTISSALGDRRLGCSRRELWTSAEAWRSSQRQPDARMTHEWTDYS